MNSNEYMNAYMKKRYRQRRILAFNILGNSCINCGSKENLELDHINPSDKTYDFSKFWNVAISKFLAEMELLQLLCKTCHTIKTSDDIGVAHGGGLSGKRNCKCEPCRVRKSIYMRERRSKQ